MAIDIGRFIFADLLVAGITNDRFAIPTRSLPAKLGGRTYPRLKARLLVPRRYLTRDKGPKLVLIPDVWVERDALGDSAVVQLSKIESVEEFSEEVVEELFEDTTPLNPEEAVELLKDVDAVARYASPFLVEGQLEALSEPLVIDFSVDAVFAVAAENMTAEADVSPLEARRAIENIIRVFLPTFKDKAEELADQVSEEEVPDVVVDFDNVVAHVTTVAVEREFSQQEQVPFEFPDTVVAAYSSVFEQEERDRQEPSEGDELGSEPHRDRRGPSDDGELGGEPRKDRREPSDDGELAGEPHRDRRGPSDDGELGGEPRKDRRGLPDDSELKFFPSPKERKKRKPHEDGELGSDPKKRRQMKKEKISPVDVFMPPHTLMDVSRHVVADDKQPHIPAERIDAHKKMIASSSVDVLVPLSTLMDDVSTDDEPPLTPAGRIDVHKKMVVPFPPPLPDPDVPDVPFVPQVVVDVSVSAANVPEEVELRRGSGRKQPQPDVPPPVPADLEKPVVPKSLGFIKLEFIEAVSKKASQPIVDRAVKRFHAQKDEAGFAQKVVRKVTEADGKKELVESTKQGANEYYFVIEAGPDFEARLQEIMPYMVESTDKVMTDYQSVYKGGAYNKLIFRASDVGGDEMVTHEGNEMTMRDYFKQVLGAKEVPAPGKEGQELPHTVGG